MNNYKQILLHYKYKIISIHWYWTTYNDKIISSLSIDSSCIHLQSLVLWSIETGRFRQLLPKLKSLPRLSSLTINSSSNLEDFKNTYRCIFQLSNLKYMRVRDAPVPVNWVPVGLVTQSDWVYYEGTCK
jgi:hypothetical protein